MLFVLVVTRVVGGTVGLLYIPVLDGYPSIHCDGFVASGGRHRWSCKNSELNGHTMFPVNLESSQHDEIVWYWLHPPCTYHGIQ